MPDGNDPWEGEDTDPGAAAPQEQPPAQEPERVFHKLALASIGAGAAGFLLSCCCGWISGPAGLAAGYLGWRAIAAIDAEPHLYKGKELAMAGMALGILGALIGLLAITGIFEPDVMKSSPLKRGEPPALPSFKP